MQDARVGGSRRAGNSSASWLPDNTAPGLGRRVRYDENLSDID